MKIAPSARFNIFYGENGSGKTSILEGIYLLGRGHSFRSQRGSHIIQYDAQRVSVFGQVNTGFDSPISLGVEKTRQGFTKIHINGEKNCQSAALVDLLPIRLVCPNSYRLLDSGPKFRRHFLDWGVFHVKHSFMSTWKSLQRALKQRNVLLRERCDRKMLRAWDQELITAAEQIDQFRAEYIESFVPYFTALAEIFFDIDGLTISYSRGWSTKKHFQQVLEENVTRDLDCGYTQQGPHRADLVIKVNQMPAQAILSRGQQKLMLYALVLAQGQCLKAVNDKQCIYLLDDLSAELDSDRRKRIADILKHMGAQAFITGVEREGFEDFIDDGEVYRVTRDGRLNTDTDTGVRTEDIGNS